MTYAWSTIEQLFYEALAQPPEERRRFLDHACAGDLALRREIDALLESDSRAGGFLSTPVVIEPVSGSASGVRVLVSGDPTPGAATHSSYGQHRFGFTAGTVIGGYRIVRPLGRGGMGEVYEAEDLTLNRQVAIKLLTDCADSAAARNRLLKEARAASSLNHPHIITIHSIERDRDGRDFLVMEYIEGSTLRQRVTAGALEIDELLTVATQIAGALAAAHARGIVHRDLKPENVMLTASRQVKLLDFGIAARSQRETSRTEPHVIIGSLSYMSPEQAAGEHADFRSDQFSLGSILYEAATGVRPFDRPTTRQTLSAVLRADAVPLSERCPRMPEPLRSVIERCLARDPADRYPSTEDLHRELALLRTRLFDAQVTDDAPGILAGDTVTDFDRGLDPTGTKLRAAPDDSADHAKHVETPGGRGSPFGAPVEARLVKRRMRSWRTALLAGVIVLAAGVAARQMLWPLAGSLAAHVRLAILPFVARPPADRIALAVLPFHNLSGDPSQEYFSDGLTEEMITQLSTVNPRGLGVLARTSAMRYKHTQKGADEIGKELHVDFLVEGSVRRENQRIRISAQLVRVSDQIHVWAKSYERDLREILVLQREVARDIANEINVSVSPAASARRSTMAALNPAAHEAYIKGRYFWNKRTKEDLRKAIEYFQYAIRDEPAYAAAYGGLADSWIALGWYGYVSPKEAFPRADEAARKALAFDDSLAAAHTSLAFVRFNYDWDWSQAERGFQRAIEIDSDYANAHHWYADYLSAIGRHEQAVTESERARRLEPLSPIINAWLGWRHHVARLYDAAVEQYRRTLELDPNFAPTHLVLGEAYEQQGRVSEALAELQQAEHLARGGPLYVAALAHALAGAGRRADAKRELRRLVEVSPGQYVPTVQIAIVHAGLGHTQEAVEWLEKGIDERSAGMVWIKVDPRFDSLRHDSRFQDIVSRLRFP